MRISDWSSDVCSSDLPGPDANNHGHDQTSPNHAELAEVGLVSVGTVVRMVHKFRVDMTAHAIVGNAGWHNRPSQSRSSAFLVSARNGSPGGQAGQVEPYC